MSTVFQMRLFGDYDAPDQLQIARRAALDTVRIDDDTDALRAIHAHGPMSCEQLAGYFGCSDEKIRLIVVDAVRHLSRLIERVEAWVEDGEEPDHEFVVAFMLAFDIPTYWADKIALYPDIDRVLADLRSLPELLAEKASSRRERVEPASISLGEVRTTFKSRATVGNFATFAPIRRKLRVLPTGVGTEVQACEPLRAKLTKAACALRWERGNADVYHEVYEPCRGCSTGQANHEALSEALERQQNEASASGAPSTEGEEHTRESQKATPQTDMSSESGPGGSM